MVDHQNISMDQSVDHSLENRSPNYLYPLAKAFLPLKEKFKQAYELFENHNPHFVIGGGECSEVLGIVSSITDV